LGKFGLLVGQPPFRRPARSISVLAVNSSSVARQTAPSTAFLAGLRARRCGGVSYSPELDLHAVDSASEFSCRSSASWAGGLVLELVDASSRARPRPNIREFRAQLVLVGLDFGHRPTGRGPLSNRPGS